MNEMQVAGIVILAELQLRMKLNRLLVIGLVWLKFLRL